MAEMIKALKLKADLHKKSARKLRTMPNSMSYADKIHQVVGSGKLGNWWKSLPSS